MKNIIKLMAAVLFTVLVAAAGNNIAYASNLTSEVEAVSGDVNFNESAGEDVNNDENLSEDAWDSSVPEGMDIGTLDTVPEGFEVYIDEQGQIYYIEITPEETEEEDSADGLDNAVDNNSEADNPEADDLKADNTEAADEPRADKDENSAKGKASSEVKKEKTASQQKPSYKESDLRLLACLVYAEAGNQPYNGMLAVANVVLNRVKSSVYWHVNTLEEVIYDNKWGVQFSVTKKNSKTGLSVLDKVLKSYDTGVFSGKDPEAEKKAMEKAIKAAKAALLGQNNIGSYLCFRVNNKSAASTKKKYPDHMIIGDHVFYRTK